MSDEQRTPESGPMGEAVAETPAELSGNSPQATAPKRRGGPAWLWCLLALLLASASPIFWYAYRVCGTATREQLTAQTRARLGVVRIELVGPRWLRRYLGPRNLRDVVGVTVPARADDEFIRRYMRPVGTIRSVWLGGEGVTDAGAAELASLSGLRELILSDTAITDNAATSLATLAALEYLDLNGAYVTDAGAARLARLPRLRRLSLANTSIRDATLEAIAAVATLEELDLRGTGISDAGLAKLAAAPRLVRLRVAGTNVTDAGLVSLRSRKPGLWIDRLDGTEQGPVDADRAAPSSPGHP